MTDRKQLIRQVKKIDITTRRRVRGLQTGRHRSVFKGQGVEFAELREYVPGDDIRSIDWKVTARLNHPYIKEFTEERDQTFYFVVDISGSGNFGSSVSKDHKALEVVASLMFAGLRNNDRIGLCLVSDRVETFVKAGKGRKHVILLLNTIIGHQPGSKRTDLAPALRTLSHRLRRECSVVIVSDFDSPPFARELSLLRNHHEVIAIRITDPVEAELPDVGYIELEDPETGDQILVNTRDMDFMARYRAVVKEADRKMENEFMCCGIYPVPLRTTEPYDVPLKRFFGGVRGRGAHGRIQ